MDNLSILLVEDDPLVCNAFIEYADKLENVSFVSITNNARKALEDIKDFLPNAIILDLELHHGGGSGLDVLQGLNNMSLKVRPYILITTNNSSLMTYEFARRLGADYILYKHQEDYSEKNALDFLCRMRTVILSNFASQSLGQISNETPNQHNKRIRQRIISELNLIGISNKAVGYQYLIDAIEITIQQPTQNICTVIGNRHGKTEASVERAMQNAINRTWKTSDIDDLLQHYTARIHSERGVPTITEFIYFYANKIKNEY